ncbi:DUF2326 domain-containing protein [Lacticaseibacillus chiayiensis]|uniref:DUF2326 domain-containing protein n=1 Tax=Lacticaseibacillus chiayiensis TaxID=2100821 RepID=A0ABY6H326_9LACO|nr:DUF2326 domain-containing protein [Lacticaseibacillus chiayiensis]UYN55756.1 DUF2326 domain-containing protein [Lacticaseibacillus chiayiensis]
MFINKLEIEENGTTIQDVNFHRGLNLIVDSTPSPDTEGKPTSGNGVGKTTVLRLIDFCFGGDAKQIYTNREQKQPIVEVQDYLTNQRVLIRLTLSGNPDKIDSHTKYVIERNFLKDLKKKILRINGRSFSSVQKFIDQLGGDLFNLASGAKPSFRQLVPRNIRIDPPAVDNTLRYLGNYLQGPEYETLFLFLLGISLTDRAPIVSKLRTEKDFLKRLEAQPREELALALDKNTDDIRAAQLRRSQLNIDPKYSEKLKHLDDLKYTQSLLASQLTAGRLRASLIKDAQKQVRSKKSLINVEELRALYGEASNLLENLETSFEQLVAYNNAMVEARSEFIGRELPNISQKNAELERNIIASQNDIDHLKADLSKLNTTQELEKVSEELGQLFEVKGRLSSKIEQIDDERKKVSSLNDELKRIDKMAFSKDMKERIQEQLRQLNRHFYHFSQSMYGEDSGVTFREKKDRKSGKSYYEFYVFSPNNSSSGKKQGEIAAFDMGYTLFAREQHIPCLDFLLYDQKELMHGNQLVQILHDSQEDNIQVIVSILADKIPEELNADQWIVLRLSQKEKLFKF